MSVIKKPDDEIRLKIIEALMQKKTSMPSIREIQKRTGLHKATIKSSLDFLEKEKILLGFGPKINFRGLGYKLEVIEMLQIDTSKKELFGKFLDVANKDPNLFRLSATIGSGTWNIIAYHIYKDVESYHKGTQQKYYEKIENIYDLVKDRQIFYATEPLYKNASRTDSVLEIIKKERGY
ncbi:MAG: Lrp/AsnC family transcriptional regulator [Candidatus Diapherotrites archaeon]|nr:Lrp/AsnC family transcriptional regulator [Candidatus Diapherotrites archaeon]